MGLLTSLKGLMNSSHLTDRRSVMPGGAPFGNHNHLKHGKRHTRIYNIWRAMRQRCSNPNCINYMRYGGKGVMVCNEWNDFETFYEWSMQNGYSDDLTIDRIDNDKGYEPSNCRWVTIIQQANNKRANRRITMNGVTHTLAEWPRITGIKSATISRRLHLGHTPEEALTRKVGT